MCNLNWAIPSEVQWDDTAQVQSEMNEITGAFGGVRAGS